MLRFVLVRAVRVSGERSALFARVQQKIAPVVVGRWKGGWVADTRVAFGHRVVFVQRIYYTPPLKVLAITSDAGEELYPLFGPQPLF